MLDINSTLLAFDFNVAGRSLLSPRSPTDPIPVAIQKLWQLAMEGSLYGLVSSIGGGIAVFAVGFWCVKFYQALEEGTLKPAVNQLIYPVILIMLLSNGGDNMRKLTMTTRDVMNNVNSMVNLVISSEVSIKSANAALSNNFWVSIAVNDSYKKCAASPYPDRIVSCLNGAKILADGWVGAQNQGVGNSAEFQEQLNKWKTAQLASNARIAEDAAKIAGANTQPGNIPAGATAPLNPSATSSTSTPGGFPPSVLDEQFYTNQSNLDSVVSTIMSFRKGFAYIIEIMMLVTGLIGPIFLGLSLFPVGTKPLIAWGVSFLSLGFCKICYSLISGLASIAFVLAGPENTDMTVVAVVLGLLAPALAFSIASNSGLSALNTISQSAQSGKISNGIGFYSPNVNQINADSLLKK
jgi:hypothetical protein